MEEAIAHIDQGVLVEVGVADAPVVPPSSPAAPVVVGLVVVVGVRLVLGHPDACGREPKGAGGADLGRRGPRGESQALPQRGRALVGGERRAAAAPVPLASGVAGPTRSGPASCAQTPPERRPAQAWRDPGQAPGLSGPLPRRGPGAARPEQAQRGRGSWAGPEAMGGVPSPARRGPERGGRLGSPGAVRCGAARSPLLSAQPPSSSTGTEDGSNAPARTPPGNSGTVEDKGRSPPRDAK